ncbi:MAG: hypothetical protein ACPG8A_07040 [Psychrobium sp.]
MKVRLIHWLLIVVVGNLLAFYSAASEIDIDNTLELYPERISHMLENPNAIELRNASIVEKQLLSTHINLIKRNVQKATHSLHGLDISSWQSHERAYYYYLTALSHTRQGRSVLAIESLQHLKGVQWPSLIEQPDFRYLLLYTRAYLAANEFDLVTNTLLQMQTLLARSSDQLANCQLAILEAEIAIKRERINDIKLHRQTLKERCNVPTDSLVNADLNLLLAQLDFKVEMIGAVTEELLQQARDIYVAQDVNSRVIDVLILSGFFFAENNDVIKSIAIKNSLTQLVGEDTPPKQLFKYYEFLVKFYTLIGDETATYNVLRQLGELNSNIQKENRTKNANFLSFRVTAQRTEMFDSIKLQKETLANNDRDYNRYLTGIVMSLVSLFLLVTVLLMLRKRRIQ